MSQFVRSPRRLAALLGGAAAVGALVAIPPANAADAATWTMGSGYPGDQNYCYSDFYSNINKYYSAQIDGTWDQPITFGVKDLPGGYSASTTLAPGSNTNNQINAWVEFDIPMQPDGVYHPVVYATDGTTTKTTTWTLTIGTC